MAQEKSGNLHCTILTPEGRVYAGEARSVVAPGADGSLGILRGHMPLITALGKGTLRLRGAGGETKEWEIKGGFLEVLKDKVSVLAERIEPAKAAPQH